MVPGSNCAAKDAANVRQRLQYRPSTQARMTPGVPIARPPDSKNQRPDLISDFRETANLMLFCFCGAAPENFCTS
jgi:hypothetical protein